MGTEHAHRRASLLGVLAVLVADFAMPATAVGVRTPTVRIMPLGDSITLSATGVLAQVHWSDRTPGGYREPLNNLLTMSRIGHVFVGTSSSMTRRTCARAGKAGTRVTAGIASTKWTPTSMESMVVPGFISDDGIHPTALGYNRMVQVYRSGVFRVLSARR